MLIDGYKLLMTYGSEKNIVLNTVYVLKWFGTNLSLQFLEHLLYLIVVRAPAPNLISNKLVLVLLVLLVINSIINTINSK